MVFPDSLVKQVPKPFAVIRGAVGELRTQGRGTFLSEPVPQQGLVELPCPSRDSSSWEGESGPKPTLPQTDSRIQQQQQLKEGLIPSLTLPDAPHTPFFSLGSGTAKQSEYFLLLLIFALEKLVTHSLGLSKSPSGLRSTTANTVQCSSLKLICFLSPLDSWINTSSSPFEKGSCSKGVLSTAATSISLVSKLSLNKWLKVNTFIPQM